MSDDQGVYQRPSTSKLSAKRYKKWRDDSSQSIPARTRRRWDTNAENNARIIDNRLMNNNLSHEESNVHPQCDDQESETSSEDDRVSNTSVDNSDDIENDYRNCDRSVSGDDDSEYSVNFTDDEDNEPMSDVSDDFSGVDGNDSACGADKASIVDKLLYENSDITVNGAVSILMNKYLRHKQTKLSLQDDLNIIRKLLPKPNDMPQTVYKLFKFIENIAPRPPTFKHYYCKECIKYYGTCNEDTCDSCGNSRGIAFFHEIDIESQIKYLFEHRDLANKLRPFVPGNNDVIQDIMDGSEYVRVNTRDDRGPYDLTLILNTDGLSLIKSSKSHCWPLLFMIAELPEYLRESFLIPIGLWYDKEKKPVMSTFLQPFVEKLKKCFHNGIQWINPINKEVNVTKIVAPLFVADAPARAELQNVQYFNGKYGCNICEIKTRQRKQTEKVIKRTRIYAFSEDSLRLRSAVAMDRQAEKAILSGQPRKGVKGRSVLTTLPLLNLSTCTLPEIMHSGLLGLGKQFLDLWFSRKKRGEWSIYDSINEINDFLTNIRPPNTFQRLPRSLTLYHYFKASEVLNWILYYSVPSLVHYLPDKYFQHWLLLVNAFYILLQDRISSSELEQAEICLRLFVREIESLYSDREYTYNVHQMLHLALCVKRWGPLGGTSAFPFESYNGFLTRIVHGTQYFAQEIINNITIAQGIEILNNKCHAEKSIRNAANYRLPKYKLLGKCKSADFINDNEKAVLESEGICVDSLKVFARMTINGEEYTSHQYKVTKTDNSNILVRDNNERSHYGSIRFFFEFYNDAYVFLQRYSVVFNKIFVHRKTHMKTKHVIPIRSEETFILLKVTDIKSICILIKVGDYLCKRPNNNKAVL